jgi:hypothetical protein
MVQAIVEVVVGAILAFVMLPASLVLATPFILASAPFRPGRIRADYVAVFKWWQEMSTWAPP